VAARADDLPDRDRVLVRCLIDALDDDGYLTQSLEELAETMPANSRSSLKSLQIALKYLQHFDPTGVGARSAQECLALQLEGLAADLDAARWRWRSSAAPRSAGQSRLRAS
jgi:RNA polymerase sigma-54 factor